MPNNIEMMVCPTCEGDPIDLESGELCPTCNGACTVPRDHPASPNGWTIIAMQEDDGSFSSGHVIPANDLREHQPDLQCPCRPTPDPEDPRIIGHHAWDGREAFENNERKPS